LLPPDRVHALAGNHDYYSHHLLIPFGFTTMGNRREEALTDIWTYQWRWPIEAFYTISPGCPRRGSTR
jgi:hypothetical protein